jgi:uncharacterized iron-regulated protein
MFAAVALSACLHVPAPAPQRAVDPPEVLLLGEVHDSAPGHAARLERLQGRLAADWRPAIAMEQFDREQQAALDAAMQDCEDAACVIGRAAPGKSGWHWDHYAPVIQLALDYDLALHAANLSRADASKVVRDGFAAALSPTLIARYHLDALPPALVTAQEAEVRDSHCGQLPEAMVGPMARAQIARDVVMAQTLRDHASTGAVLLAGNGHVRRDIGVPYWLRLAGLAPVAVGFLEPGGAADAFDEVVSIPQLERPDPCAAFGKAT